MSEYNTGNPPPSIDPRDLDDNATVLDRLLNQQVASALDRLNVPRKTWWQMEQDAVALVSPNVAALAGLAGSANMIPYFTGAGALSLTSLLALATLASPVFTGDPKAPTPTPGDNDTSIATTAFVQAAITALAPLASPTFTGDPKAPTATVGANDTSIATTAFVQAAIANKRAWTAYTPTITLTSGTYTAANASGKYMVAFGICHVQLTLLVTTKGTGTLPILSLPLPALTGSLNMSLLARENVLTGKMGCAPIRADLASVLPGAYDSTDLITANGASITINGSYPVA